MKQELYGERWEVGQPIDFEKRKEWYAKAPIIDKVFHILREQPRDLETIGWGVYQVFGDQLDMRTLLDCLEKLEKQGKAIRCESNMPGMPTGNWWKLAGEDEGL